MEAEASGENPTFFFCLVTSFTYASSTFSAILLDIFSLVRKEEVEFDLSQTE